MPESNRDRNRHRGRDAARPRDHGRELTLTVGAGPAGASVLRLSGDLDFRSAPRLRRSLDHLPMAPGSVLVVDLSGVGHCDSTGLAVLVMAHRRTRAADAELALAGAGADLGRALRSVGLDQVLTLHDSVDQALAAFDQLSGRPAG